jgi:hypothetical protein
MRTRSLRWIAVATLAAAGWAQDPRGRITGQVTDPSGASVANADVRAKNVNTGVTASAKTTDAGAYALPYLMPGVYSVSVEAKGFKQTIRDNIQVQVDSVVELAIGLEVGELGQSIRITAEAPQLATAEASLGSVVDQRRLEDLPTFGGSVMGMILFAPGAVNTTNLRVIDRSANDANSEFSTDGAGRHNNEFSIDGVSNTIADNRGGNTARIGYIPPEAAIGEFKMQTAPYDASVGHTSGSLVNVSIKSGTNGLHGQLYWIARNRVFDAPDLFQNRSRQKVPAYQYNRYGLAAGGPILVPGVYSGRNRSFWFYNWEANKYGNPQTFIASVPTAAERRGDLSGLLALGADYQVYDPATDALQANAQVRRQPFAGNVIPSSRLDPVAQNLLPYWPLPNQPGTSDGRQNWFYSEPTRANVWNHLFRFDHAFSERQRAFVRFNADSWDSTAGRTFNNNARGFVQNRSNRGMALDDVMVLSPSLLLNVRYGLIFQSFEVDRLSNGTDYAALGFSKNLISQLAFPNNAPLPYVGVTPWDILSPSNTADGRNTSLVQNANITFTRMTGGHSIRFGADLRLYRRGIHQNPYERSPQFAFSSGRTRGPLTTSANPRLGGEIAAFLLGLPGGTMDRNASSAEQDWYTGFFVQDDFRLTRRLRVNVGIRYEYEAPITERYDRSVAGFAFGVANPVEAQAQARYARSPMPELPASSFRVPGGLTFVNQSGTGRGYWEAQTWNFMPRLGLAYQVNSKTVLRAGYGIFYSSRGTSTNNPIQYGFSQSTPVLGSLDESGVTHQAVTADPFPGGLIAPAGANGGLTTFLGQAISFNPTLRLHPYSQRWSAGGQRQLPAGVMLEASYVGNRGTRLDVSRNLNATPARYLSTSPNRDNAVIASLGQTFPSPFQGLASVFGASMSRANLLRPYPEFGNITVADPAGYSWYHSLQMRAERRLMRGYTVQAAYTWSKAMEATSFLNATDPMPYRGISSFDRTHRFTASAVWELPFGRGRVLGAGLPPAADKLIGGWQLNFVMQRQSGPPLGFGDAFALFTGSPDNIVLAKDKRSVDRWFNTQAGFNRNTAEQLSQNIRVSPLLFSGVRGDGQARYDFSAIKNVAVWERLTLQIRAECINAWNHPNLAVPNTTPTSTAFGTITSQDPPRTWQFSARLRF